MPPDWLAYISCVVPSKLQIVGKDDIMPHRTHILALSLLLAAPLTFAQSSPAPGHTVTGTVSYRQRIALPPDAIVRLVLEDVSLADAPAKSIGEAEVPTGGKQVPIAFDIKYDPAALDPAHRYQIRATITSGGKPLFTTATAYPVLTHGAPEKQVEILVEPVPAPPDNTSAAPLTGTHWTLAQLNDQTIAPQSGRAEIYLELAPDSKRISGSGGCNRLMGAYELDGSTLRFTQVASTMMACPGDAMPREQAFVKALSDTTGFRIHGATLTLLDKNDAVLAHFEAQSADKP